MAAVDQQIGRLQTAVRRIVIALGRVAVVQVAKTSPRTRVDLRQAKVLTPELPPGSTEVPVIWTDPMLTASYVVGVTVSTIPANFGTVIVGIRAGTISTAGCVISVTNLSAVTTIPASQMVLHVIGFDISTVA